VNPYFGEPMDKRCPRGLKCLPTEPCPEGRKAVDLARKGVEGGCPWAIADQESNYCVFKLLGEDGRPMDTAKVARLAMVDDSEVKKIISNFRKKVLEEGELI